MTGLQRWYLTHQGHDHVIEVAQGSVTREVSWTRDGTELGAKKATDDTMVLAPAASPSGSPADEVCAVRLKFPMWGPARRVTLHRSEMDAHAGIGGTDFEPEPGSTAALRAEWIGRHPHLHLVRQTAVATAAVTVPLLLVWLLTLIPQPDLDIPWPDINLPSIPWPDLPSIPWPDINLPSIPWPELPGLPEWLEPVRQFIVPVLIAFFIARGEVKRRQRIERKKAAEKAAAAKEKKVEDKTAD